MCSRRIIGQFVWPPVNIASKILNDSLCLACFDWAYFLLVFWYSDLFVFLYLCIKCYTFFSATTTTATNGNPINNASSTLMSNDWKAESGGDWTGKVTLQKSSCAKNQNRNKKGEDRERERRVVEGRTEGSHPSGTLHLRRSVITFNTWYNFAALSAGSSCLLACMIDEPPLPSPPSPYAISWN